jgi:hypothetical protein
MIGFPVRVMATSLILWRRLGLIFLVRTAVRRLIILDGLQAFCMVTTVLKSIEGGGLSFGTSRSLKLEMAILACQEQT